MSAAAAAPASLAPASLARPAQGARPGVRLRPQISSAPAAASCASSQRRRRAPLPVSPGGRAGSWGPGGLVGDGAGPWATRRRAERLQHVAGPTARPAPWEAGVCAKVERNGLRTEGALAPAPPAPQSWAGGSHALGQNPLQSGPWSLVPLLSLGQEWVVSWVEDGALVLGGRWDPRSAALVLPHWGQLL